MADVTWADEALRDLEAIHDYIAPDSPRAAIGVAHALIAAGNGLELFPNRGLEPRQAPANSRSCRPI
ncbi:type II toxin-antitoxin system RelE/ParE family toxin [Phenylobacterium sp.]|uniref:type II toxin-antitoxin system RelE/ParE family toxin n=1 Tax=Phenylobacterium sp. TaxID=1871053 RepID=UPI0025F5A63D|nr:type II toxin-antitoxin system RelE/ParE family toxin [Phenylobacterium sp.]